MEANIFDKFVSQKTLFKNKENLRHNYRPTQLPHRQEEIEKISYNLWEALKGHIPSNMTLYGVTGAGKTAVTDYVCLLYTSPSPRDRTRSRMPSSA